VDAASVSKIYKDSIQKTRNPALAHVINNQFTFGPSYSYTYNTNTDDSRVNSIYYNGKISESASLLGLLMGADTVKGKVKSLFGTPFNQYIKLENDLRYYHKFTPGLKFATRLQVGVGYAYGNSTQMPYSQQFFIGGPNSLRGFQARSLGPGAYILPPSLNTGNNFLADESGDIKIEANAEFRPKLFSIVEGALFVDAGNIWLLHPNKLQPSAAFGANFINQMAVDAGVGLRFNLTVLVLRTDFGFPLVKPELPASQRTILNGIDYTDARWHGANMIFNLAIGYPF
jgi:outer membrane protein assembly factor BamA